MKRQFFLVSLLFFRDCRSTNLLRLFSGNLPAMFVNIANPEIVLLDAGIGAGHHMGEDRSH